MFRYVDIAGPTLSLNFRFWGVLQADGKTRSRLRRRGEFRPPHNGGPAGKGGAIGCDFLAVDAGSINFRTIEDDVETKTTVTTSTSRSTCTRYRLSQKERQSMFHRPGWSDTLL